MRKNMNNEYGIINITSIQKRIEELEDRIKNDGLFLEEIQHYKGQIFTLKQILSQSTSLIPEIEKAFDAGAIYLYSGRETNSKKEYVWNLNLEIQNKII